MARAHFLDVVQDRYGNAVVGASVEVRQPGTAIPIVDPLYAAAVGVGTLANPLTTDVNGEFGFWLDAPQTVDLYVSGAGVTPRTEAGVQVGGLGGTRLIDLGILNVVDLLVNGPKTLYVPSGPEMVQIIVGEDDYVASDARDIRVGELRGGHIPDLRSGGVVNFLMWVWNLSPEPDDVPKYMSGQEIYPVPMVISWPLVAGFFGPPLQKAAIGGWQPNRASSLHASDTVFTDHIMEAGYFWLPCSDGVSGNTIPDFAAAVLTPGQLTPADGTIWDGSGGWYLECPVPTVGSLHLYALVATPVTP